MSTSHCSPCFQCAWRPRALTRPWNDTLQALRAELEAAQAKAQSAQQEAAARAEEAARLSDSSAQQQDELQERVAALSAQLAQEQKGRTTAASQVQVRQLLIWGAIVAHCALCTVMRM